MPPKRGSKPKADSDDNDESDKPSYDSNERNLRLYLLEMKRWLPRKHVQLNNLLRWSFIMNSRQEVIVYDTDQQDKLQDGTIVRGSFEELYIHEEDYSSGDEECSEYSCIVHVSNGSTLGCRYLHVS